jgi:hypothetical protein
LFVSIPITKLMGSLLACNWHLPWWKRWRNNVWWCLMMSRRVFSLIIH